MRKILSKEFWNQPAVRIPMHVLFWLAYLLFSALNVMRLYEDQSLIQIIIRFACTAPVDVLASYFTAYFLIPKLLYQRKYLVFIVVFLLSAIAAILIQRLIIWYFTYPVLLDRVPTSNFFLMNWFYSFTNIYIIVFFVSGIKIIQRSFRVEKDTKELNEKKIEAELKFLKAQVHPHFLFNTLNNLYALTLESSPKAPEIVLKLSELMNYMLYECNENTILLSKEISLIENYLSLERIRYEDNLDLSFLVEGETTGKRIAPMVLLPFVENAFKHGISKLAKSTKLELKLEVNGNELKFNAQNQKPIAAQTDPAGYTEGIGLKNVTRRLELMYPEHHALNYQISDTCFEVTLELKLEP